MAEVKVVDLPEQPIAVIKDRAKQSELSQKVPDYCGKVWNFIKANNIKSNGRMVATYRGNDMNDLQIEVGAEVDAPFKENGNVVNSSLPAGKAAMVTHVGPYNELPKAYDALFTWCKQNGHQTGVCWELYHHPSPDGPPKTDIYAHLKT